MKHTFVIIDQLMQVLNSLDRLYGKDGAKVEISPEMIAKLNKVLGVLEEYAIILDKLVTNHKVEKNLAKLKKVHEGEIDDWANKVDDTFKQMDSLLIYLESDIEKVRKVLANEPLVKGKLYSAIADISQGMFMTGLHDDEKHLEKLRQLELFKIDELKDIVNHEKHHKGLSVWLGIVHLTEHERELEMEKYFKALLS